MHLLHPLNAHQAVETEDALDSEAAICDCDVMISKRKLLNEIDWPRLREFAIFTCGGRLALGYLQSDVTLCNFHTTKDENPYVYTVDVDRQYLYLQCTLYYIALMLVHSVRRTFAGNSIIIHSLV